MPTPFGNDRDIYYMSQALAQARKAFLADEVPVGAIVVDAEGIIIARSYNRVESCYTQSVHAEITALAKAGKKLKNWRLQDCWLYVTLEPCSMCMHMAALSRIKGVVYGAISPLFGYHLDNTRAVQVYKNGTLETIEHLESKEACELLKNFFHQKRKKSE